MTGRLDGLRLCIVPGDGVVARTRGAVLFALPASAREHGFVNELLSAVEAVAGDAPGRRLARRLAGLLALAEPADTPAFCALAEGEDGTVAIVHGAVEVMVTGPQMLERMTGRGVATWLDRTVSDGWDRLSVLPCESPEPVPDPWINLRAGVVRGGGFVVETGEPRPMTSDWAVAFDAAPSAPASWPPVAAPDAAAPVTERGSVATEQTAASVESPPALGEFEVVSLLDADEDERRSALPLAGSAGGPAPSTGAAAPGWLVLDTGDMFLLDADYVVGRRPHLDPAVERGDARPLALADPEQLVSRVHARVRRVAGDIVVEDAGSANGSFVAPAGVEDWRRLPAGEPIPVADGTRVMVGDVVIRFELPAQRSGS